MKKKLRVAILFGGKSAEHEISLQSAKNIVEAIDKRRYQVVLIGVDRGGQWRLSKTMRGERPSGLEFKTGKSIALIPGKNARQLVFPSGGERVGPVDIVFPILHGPFGEDGTVQGLLKLANLPFVGAGVLGSAVGMDKDVLKRLMRDAGIRTADFLVLVRSSLAKVDFYKIKRRLRLPLFVKPANLGSSVGIHKVKDKDQFMYAIRDAFKFDSKVLVEESIQGREIECAVLGNDHPIASVPGEIVTRHEFYSYQAKYQDEFGAVLKIPAKLPSSIAREIQELSIKVFKVLCCEGMARVDFFLRNNREVLVNEINTLPGFTKISMYPKLWEASGISYKELIDKLIRLALERFNRETKLRTSL